jgi:hypothetical protein
MSSAFAMLIGQASPSIELVGFCCLLLAAVDVLAVDIGKL